MPAPLPSSEGLLEGLLTARFVIVTGKGGVGKTTVAAAIARAAAARGKRVLAAEVGQLAGAPSPLLGALSSPGQYASVEPLAIAPNLDCVLLTPETGHRAFLRDALPLGFLADAALKAEPVRRFLSAAPAFQELGVLYRGLQLLKMTKGGKPRWDLLVLDSPATGHTIAFASLPEVMLKIIPAGPIARAMREGLELLTDPKRTMAVVTTLPEALPVSEALELVKGLEKHRIHVHGIIANQVPADPFSLDEHVILSTWLAANGNAQQVLGSRSVARLKRSSAALARLREGLGRAIATVKELAVDHPSLVDAVSSELEGPK